MATKPTLASRFDLASAQRRYRTIMLISGDAGTGKTSFALSGPTPMLVQSFDKGMEGVVEPFVEAGKEIYLREYDWHPGTENFSQDYAITLRKQFIEDYEVALDSGARLVVWDKETDVWELFRYAEFGKPNDSPKDYAKLNQRYKALIERAKATDASLIVIEATKDDWGQVGPVSGTTGKRSLTKTGTRSRRGFDSIDEIVFVETQFRREAGEFYIDVKKCRQNSALQDQAISKDDMPDGRITFVGFGQLLMPGSAESDWL